MVQTVATPLVVVGIFNADLEGFSPIDEDFFEKIEGVFWRPILEMSMGLDTGDLKAGLATCDMGESCQSSR